MNNQPNEAPKRPDLPTGRVLVGDALDRLRRLPSEAVDCIVTSPPYFLLRNYGVDGQIGHEASVDGWVDQLLAVMGEVGRVLKPGGSVWLNLGDTYSRHLRHGAQPKGLVLGPERLLLALSEAGWTVRNKIVWAKPNPMPTAVKDRLSCTWEPLYLLTRDRRYYFDLDAIRVPARSRLNRPARVGRHTKYGSRSSARPDWSGPLAGNNSGLDRMKASGQTSHPLGKNPGDVWNIPTASYRGAHFATFPPALVERPLLAACPERTCRSCGAPWTRARVVPRIGTVALKGSLCKSCSCTDRAWEPGVVLDPFFGAGTVGVVAEQLNRRWVGIELSPEFAALARQRISAEQGHPSEHQQRSERQHRSKAVKPGAASKGPRRLLADPPDLQASASHQADDKEQQNERQDGPEIPKPARSDLGGLRRLHVGGDQDPQEQRLDGQKCSPGSTAEAEQAVLPPVRRHIRPERRVRHEGPQRITAPRPEHTDRQDEKEHEVDDRREHLDSLPTPSDSGGET